MNFKNSYKEFTKEKRIIAMISEDRKIKAEKPSTNKWQTNDYICNSSCKKSGI